MTINALISGSKQILRIKSILKGLSWSMNCSNSLAMGKKTVNFSISIFTILSAFISLAPQVAKAQGQCVDLFTQESNQQVIYKMTAEDLEVYKNEFNKLDARVRNLERRIRTYSELTGSETNRSLVEAESYASKIKDQVRLGLTTKVIEKIGALFKRYEVDIRLSEKLKIEIAMLYQMKTETDSSAKLATIDKQIRGKQAEKNVLDKHIGANYYRYITLKEALNQMAQSKVEVVSERSIKVLSELEKLSAHHAATYGLEFKRLDVDDVRRFVQSNISTQYSVLKKAAVDEFFLMLRLMTFSGPIVNGIKAVVYKVPEKIIMGPFVIPARKVISEAFQVGYNQHLRSTYLEDIEMIIEARNPVEQYELLRSLNVKSERPDELIELFARVVENTEEWEAIKSVAANKAGENERLKLFYDKIMSADKSALAKDAFPLYYQESGANAFGKIILGSYVSTYLANKYVASHPETVDSFFNGLHQFATTLQNVYSTALQSIM